MAMIMQYQGMWHFHDAKENATYYQQLLQVYKAYMCDHVICSSRVSRMNAYIIKQLYEDHKKLLE